MRYFSPRIIFTFFIPDKDLSDAFNFLKASDLLLIIIINIIFINITILIFDSKNIEYLRQIIHKFIYIYIYLFRNAMKMYQILKRLIYLNTKSTAVIQIYFYFKVFYLFNYGIIYILILTFNKGFYK